MTALAQLLADPFAPVAESAGYGRAPVAGDSFAHQWEYVTSESKYNAVCCSRQAGKTSGATLAAEVVLSHPGTKVIYATLIRRNAKKLFWWPLLEGLQKRGWSVGSLKDKNESDLMLWLPNGSFLQALSCSEMADLATIRGDQADLFIVDECQEPRDDVLDALVTKIVPAMLMKRDGRLDLLGTVPQVEPCTFSDRLDDPKWRHFGWTCFDNPFMDHAAIRRTCEEAGLVPGHPVYEREILGRRVRDPASLAYEYDQHRNAYDPALVDFETGPWRHAMGLDLGFQDRDAIVVLGWRRDDPDRRVYVRHAWQQNHLDVDQLHDVVREVLGTYRIGTIVGDHGGHGATKVLETLKARLGVQIEVKPTDVMVSVGLVNDDLRTGRLLIPAGSELGADLGKVQRTVNPHTKRIEINKKGYHSDLSEALRYAHHGARHYAAKAPKADPVETRHDRRDRQWREDQRRQHDPWR